MSASPHAPAPTRRAPRALWAIAQAFMIALYNLFGGPEDIARAGWLARARQRQLSHWLNAARAILARLLLVEAAALPAPAPSRRRVHIRTPRPARRIEHDPDAPEAWRVRLRLAPPRRCFARKPRRTPTTQRDFSDPWPLAERYEAILRAYNNPAPYAQRLARRLHAAPQRACALLVCPKHTHAIIGRDNLATLTEAAGAAIDALDPHSCICAPRGISSG